MTCKLKISLKAAIYVIYQRRFKDIKLTKIIKWEGAGGGRGFHMTQIWNSGARSQVTET